MLCFNSSAAPMVCMACEGSTPCSVLVHLHCGVTMHTDSDGHFVQEFHQSSARLVIILPCHAGIMSPWLTALAVRSRTQACACLLMAARRLQGASVTLRRAQLEPLFSHEMSHVHIVPAVLVIVAALCTTVEGCNQDNLDHRCLALTRA